MILIRVILCKLWFAQISLEDVKTVSVSQFSPGKELFLQLC